MESFSQVVYNQRGVIFATLSSVMWAMNGLGAKIITKAVSPWIIAYACCLSYLLFIPWLKWENMTRYVMFDNIFMILAGLCDVISLYLATVAFSLTSVGNASAIIFSKPVFCALLSSFVLKEKFAACDCFIVIVNVIGVLLITNPFSICLDNAGFRRDSYHVLGSISALGAAVSGSVAFISVRKLVYRDTYDPFLVLLAKCIIGFVTFSVVLSFEFTSRDHMQNPSDWGCLLAVCFTGVCACVLVYAALQTETASTVCAISTAQVVISYLLQVVFTDDVIDFISVLGAVLILSAPLWYAVQGILQRSDDEVIDPI